MYAFLVTALVSDFFVTLWTIAHQAPLGDPKIPNPDLNQISLLVWILEKMHRITL